MNCLITGISILACLLIGIQDLRKREIHIAPVLLLAMGGLLMGWGENGYFQFLLTNLIVLSLIILILFLVFWVKGKGRFMDRQLGWGDVAVLAAIAFWLAPEEYVVFYTVCVSVLSLIYGFLQLIGRLPTDYPVPLAGLLCLAFALFLPVDLLITHSYV